MCLVRTAAPRRDRPPPICIRHDMSTAATTSALVSMTASSLSSRIALDVSAFLIANVPPNPQHSVARGSATRSRPSTARRRSSGASPSRRARSEWHVGWYVTRCGKDAPTSVTPRCRHEKLGQLQHPGCEGAHRPRELRVLHLLGEVGVEVAHHRHARSRRCDDDLGVGEDAHESTRESRGGVLIPGVEVELPATRLCVGELDVVTEPLEHAHCRDPRFGEERVVETRDEERDAQGAA